VCVRACVRDLLLDCELSIVFSLMVSDVVCSGELFELLQIKIFVTI